MISYLKSKKGYTLLALLGAFLLIVLLVIAITQGIQVYSMMSERIIKKTRAKYLAEAGINDCYLRMFFGWRPASATQYILNVTTTEYGGGSTARPVTVIVTPSTNSSGSAGYIIRARADLY